jgi:hypothetical protein
VSFSDRIHIIIGLPNLAMASSLAKEIIRAAASGSEEWDLKNYSQPKVEELVAAAFKEPLPLNEMVRFSFIVGAGTQTHAREHSFIVY